MKANEYVRAPKKQKSVCERENQRLEQMKMQGCVKENELPTLENIYEVWSASNGHLYLYTEDMLIYNLLRKITSDYATYERRGKVFGWQFLLSKNKLRFILKLVKINSLKNNKLQGLVLSNLSYKTK
jgi:hypothetical protein